MFDGASTPVPVEGISLIKMVVTNSLGRTLIPATGTEEERSLIGSYGYVTDAESGKKDPYHFWAVENPTDTVVPAYQITMVLPLGGRYSGLYRYPKIGEQVLVAAQNKGGYTDYYMMGYVPSNANPFNAASGSVEGSERIFEEQGEILRYANTAHGNNLYSELGFYRAEKAQWPVTAGEEDFPPIDVLVLDSAGNIRQTAANHHIQKAKRIEILANAPEVLDRKTNAVDAKGTLPIGEYPGDDASLHRGDVHIRAGNRVVIKADQEIRLQVGRTIFRIDDTGLNAVTKNVTGNYANSYDTMLDMNPRNGINMTGKNINLKALHRLNAGDGMGGTVAATMGNLSLGGREINIESYDNTEYLCFTVFQALEYLVNAASGGMALAKEDIKIADYMKFTQENLEALLKVAKKIQRSWAKRKEMKEKRKNAEQPPESNKIKDDGISKENKPDEEDGPVVPQPHMDDGEDLNLGRPSPTPDEDGGPVTPQPHMDDGEDLNLGKPSTGAEGGAPPGGGYSDKMKDDGISKE